MTDLLSIRPAVLDGMGRSIRQIHRRFAVSSIRAEIMALLPEERLEYAISVLEDWSGEDLQEVHETMKTSGLTFGQAKVVRHLRRVAPRAVTVYALADLLGRDCEKNGMASMIKWIRKRGVPVKTAWGLEAYYMEPGT